MYRIDFAHSLALQGCY